MSNKLESNAIGQPLPSTALKKPSAQPGAGAGVTSVGTVKAWKKTERTILCHVTYPACALALFSIAGGVSFGLAGMLTMPILAAVAIGGTASAVVLLVSGLICLLTDLRLLSSLQENSGASTDRGLDIQRRSEAHRTSRVMEGAVISVEPVKAENLAQRLFQEIAMTVDSQNLQLQHYKLITKYTAEPSYDEEFKQLRGLTEEEKQRIATFGTQMTAQLSEIQGLVDNGKSYKDFTVNISQDVTKQLKNLEQMSDEIKQSLTQLKAEQANLKQEQKKLDEQVEQFEQDKTKLSSMNSELLQQQENYKSTIETLEKEIKQKEQELAGKEEIITLLRETTTSYNQLYKILEGTIGKKTATGEIVSISSLPSSRENSPLTLGNNDDTVSDGPVSNGSLDSDGEIDGRQIPAGISSQNGENGALASSSNRTSGILKGPTEKEDEMDNSQDITSLKNPSLLKNNAKNVDVIEASNNSGSSQPSSQVPSFFGLF